MKKFLYILLYFFPLLWRPVRRCIFVLLLAGGGTGGEVHAQNLQGTSKIDSLFSLLQTDRTDTNKVKHFNVLSREYIAASSFDSAMKYANSALQLAQSLPFQSKTIKKEISTAYSNIGRVFYQQGNYKKTLMYWLKALKIDEELNDKKGIAKRLGNIGSVYNMQGDYNMALEHYSKALKIGEELKDNAIITKNLGNMGVIYDDRGDYPKALELLFRALRLDEQIGNKNNIAIWLGDIGNIYQDEGEYSKALDYYFKALKINEELQSMPGSALIFNNLGNTYTLLTDYKRALEYYLRSLQITEEIGERNGSVRAIGNIGVAYKDMGSLPNVSQTEKNKFYDQASVYFFKALKMNEELGDKNAIARNLANIGVLRTMQKKYVEAEKYLIEAGKQFKELGAMDFERELEASLSELYTKTKRFELALKHYKNAMELKDTLFSEEKNKEITRKEMNYEFEKKEAAAKAEQDKLAAVAAAESSRQRLFLWLIGAVAGAIGIIALIIFRALRVTRKQKGLIEKQKALVEEHQKEILDSIYYARRIQRALLPNEKYIERNLKSFSNN